MAEVRAQLVLESSDALSTVDALGTALDTVVTNFSTSFTAELAGLQAPIADLAATPLVEQVTADTSAAENAIGALDATPVEVPVEADTSGAEAAIADLGDSASGASDKITGLGDSTKFLEGAAAAATGEVGGLRTAAEGMGAGGLIGYSGAAALATGLAGLAEEGIKAASAQQRFNLIVGQSADAFKTIHVGDLNISLDELRTKLGATTAEMQNAIATVYLHGQAAGFSTEKTVQYSQELVALGARAVATNPSLGNLGDVIDGLDVKFARSRGLVQYGISLAQADINNLALQQSGKATAADLTVQDKAFAGLTLSVQKYGDGLSEKIAKGSENAAIQQRALTAEIKNAVEEIGKPLVAPFLEVLQAGVPIIKDVASGLALLGPLLSILAPLAPVLEGLALGFIAVKAAAGISTVLGLVSDGFLSLAITAPAAEGAMLGVATAAETASVGMAAVAGPIGITVAVIALAATAGKGLASLLGQAPSDNFPQAIDKTNKLLTDNFHLTDEATKRLFDYNTALRVVENGQSASAASLASFKELLAQSPTAAQSLIGSLDRTGESTARYQKLLDQTTASAIKNADAVTHNTTATSLATFATNVATAAQSAKSNADKAAASTAAALVAVTGQNTVAVQKEATAYATAQQAASDYKASLDVLNVGHLSLAQAEQTIFSQELQLKSALTDSKGAIDLNTDAGNKSYAAILQRVSGEQAYETALTASTGSTEAAAKQQGAFRQSLVDTLTTMGVAPAEIEPLLQKLGVDLPDAAKAGAAATDTALTGPTGISASAQKGIDQAAALFNVDPLAAGAYLFGYGTGQHFEAGITNALKNAALPDSMAPQAAKEFIRAIKFALDNAGSPSEHLFYDSGVSHVSAYASGFQDAGSDVVAQAQAITRAAASTGVAGSPSSSPALVGAGVGGPSVQQNFYGYSPQETAAVTGREWTRLTRFSGGG